MTKSTPVCIIGAGPAGLTTAFYLAKAGIECTIVDKDAAPKDKTCGDILTSVTLRELRKLFPNITESISVTEQMMNNKGVIIHAPNYHYFTMDYRNEEGTEKPLCYTCKRTDLDAFLVKKAKEHPLIDVIEHFEVRNVEHKVQEVTITDKQKRQIKTPLVIVAAGSNSNIANKLTNEKKDPKHFAVGLKAYYKNVTFIAKDFGELFIRKELPAGALYITPFYDGVVNLNISMRADVLKKRKVNLRHLLADILENDEHLKDRFKDAEMIGKIEGSGLKLGTKARSISGDNFLLTGDAAGLIDILSANGLPQAFISGRIAAEYAIKAVEQNDYSAGFFAPFDKEVFEVVDKYLKKGRLIAPYIDKGWYHTISCWIMNLFAKHIKNNKALSDVLIYESDVKGKILKPSFYFNMFFRGKQQEKKTV